MKFIDYYDNRVKKSPKRERETLNKIFSSLLSTFSEALTSMDSGNISPHRPIAVGISKHSLVTQAYFRLIHIYEPANEIIFCPRTRTISTVIYLAQQ
jgi:hypothetical protein